MRSPLRDPKPPRYWSIHAEYCTSPARVAQWARDAVDCRASARRALENGRRDGDRAYWRASARTYAMCARFYEKSMREAAAYLLARGAGPMRSF